MMHSPPIRVRPRSSLLAAVVVALTICLAACSDASQTDDLATEPGAAEPSDAVETGDSGETDTDGPESTEEAGTADDQQNDQNPPDELADVGDTTEESAAEPAPSGPVQGWDAVDHTLLPVASLSEPIALTARPGSPDLWVAERSGRVRLIQRFLDEAAGTEELRQLSTPVLDISDRVGTGGEGGLLGLAFSADGQRLYVHYTDRQIDNVISEFTIDGTTADVGSERVLLRIEQPFANHNGGDLQLGPDGMLYTGIGDGGSADDPLESGQDPTTLLGTMLRIDPTPGVDGPYSIPGDNPFAGDTEGRRAEIWSFGLRNPWRFSFDSTTGDLWIADVGQGAIEEINLVTAESGNPGRGANFGWNLMEGDEPFAGSEPPDHTPPLYVYRHEGGRCSITGGHVYRGSLATDLSGIYLYADYCTNEVYGLERTADGEIMSASLTLDRSVKQVVSFGVGPDGETYVLEQGGRISRIQPIATELATTITSG